MDLGLSLGTWYARPPSGVLELVREAERLGYDAVFTAENYGSDAYTPLTWWGSHTDRIRLGTSLIPIGARTPTATAMAALTLDHLSGGRHILGMGVSGPGVIEGWFGQPFDRPLERTREYVDIVRQVLRRDAVVTSEGRHYPLPYRRSGQEPTAPPLKCVVHPLRPDLPIWLGAEGPKNVALCAEIADGWLPMLFAPKMAAEYRSWLAEGFARPGARQTPETFEIASACRIVVTDDRERALDDLRPMVGFYIGGMGTRERNFHKDVFERMGYAAEANLVQDLFYEGKRDEAYAAVPVQAVADIALVGSRERIRDELGAWEDAGVTMVVVGATDVDQLRSVAEAVLG